MGTFDDIRLALRTFRRKPGFPSSAILILALAVGATASVFSLVKAILLEPLPMLRPHELVALDAMRPDGTRYPFTIPYFMELRDHASPLSSVAAYGGVNMNFADEAAPERVLGVRATGNFFPMLGIAAQVGRLLEPDDDEPGRPKVVVVADTLWRRRFGGDRGAIGKQVRLNGDSYTLVGVLPPSFQFKNPGQEFAIPLSPASDPFRGVWNSTAFLRVYARMPAGVSIIQAKAALDEAAGRIRREHFDAVATIVSIDAQSLQENLTGDAGTLLTVLMGAVVLVLLIACANIASLALARAAGRTKELSIRLALGADRWSVARQIVVENILIFALGGVAGLCVARWGVDLLVAIMPAELPRLREVRLDWLVAFAGMGAALTCGLLFGSIPAIKTQKTDLNETLRADGRGNTNSRGRSFLFASLVIAEVTLSLVLLAGAGLLLQSFHRIMSVDPGFRSLHLTTFRLALPSTHYKAVADITSFHDAVLDRVRIIPGVENAGTISILPFSGPTASSDFTIVGAPPTTEAEKPSAQYRVADSGYFRTMKIPIRRGREFNDSDTTSSSPVVVISESMATRYWKGKDPVGRAIRIEDNLGNPRTAEVIGIAGDARESSLEEKPVPCLYVPMPQVPKNILRFLTNSMFLTVRTSAAVDVSAAVRRGIGNVDRDVAVSSSSMDEYFTRATAKRRFVLSLLSTFAMCALLLAAGGLYALISFSNTQRTREFALRMVLGATRASVARLVLRQGIFLVVLGTAAGGLTTLAVSRSFASMLFEVSPANPIAFGCATLLLLMAAVGACIIPMRRAMRSDPNDCLRSE